MAASENNATTLECFYFVILTNQHTFYYANTPRGNTRDSNRFFYVLKPQGNQSWAVFFFSTLLSNHLTNLKPEID